jgi:hypothetical protein
MTSVSTKGTVSLLLTYHVSIGSPLSVHYRYKDGDLSVGENTCIDRCSSKYWQVTGIVGQMLGAQQGGP